MYEVYAAMVRVPVAHRANIISLKYATQSEAVDQACHLRRLGWFVYRVAGPGGFEMLEQSVDQHCQMPHRGA